MTNQNATQLIDAGADVLVAGSYVFLLPTHHQRSLACLLRSIHKQMPVVLGLMSGTSLDGLDLCCVRFSSNLKDFQILESKTVPILTNGSPNSKRHSILQLTKSKILDKAFGVFLAERFQLY
ncbi:MAG: hypothetical protein CM15mP59_2450 [Flavobacteriaceae bacterium]|nr:MAG: hypothetical protein CM15mP59_2450 [Flavobacteriaceae bacterium]